MIEQTLELDFQVIIPSHPKRPRYYTYNSLLPLGKERLLHVLGYPCAYARNKGIALAKAKVIVQTDDDAIIPPNIILKAVSLVKPRTFVRMSGELFLLAGYREDFIRLGGFDERIKPFLAEDNEFICRALCHGYKIITLPRDPAIKHYGGKTPYLSKRWILETWNHTIMLVRYGITYLNEKRSIGKALRYLFAQWYPLSAIPRMPIRILAFLYWMIRSNIGRRNSFGW